MIELLFPLAILLAIIGYAAVAASGRRFAPRALLHPRGGYARALRGWVRLDDEVETADRR